jgi:phosphate transport system substrate-binding protein
MAAAFRLAIIAWLLLAPALAGAQQRIVITGSTTIYPLMKDIVERFQSRNPGVSIELSSGGSGKGIADLRAGASDIAMLSRGLADNERDLFSYPLCRDGAAIVVHSSSPLKGLSRRQLSELLTGKISDWQQLGARPGAVKLAWRAEGQAIPELILQQLKLKPEQIRSHTRILENADAIAFVATDRNAITLAALGVAERALRAGARVKLLAYGGIPASTRAVRDHTYLLSRPLALVTRSTPEGLQKRLIDYAASSAVTDLQEKHGFVPYQD